MRRTRPYIGFRPTARGVAPILVAFLTFVTLLPASAKDMDCGDFGSQGEAQAYFEERGGSAATNVDRLDGNGDGIACDSHDYQAGGAGAGSAPTALPLSPTPADRTFYDEPTAAPATAPAGTPVLASGGRFGGRDALGLTALAAGGAAAALAAVRRRRGGRGQARGATRSSSS